METVRSYRELLAWQKAMDLVVSCYKLTEQFPSAEKFGLTNQLRRAAVSVPANIAEGSGRQHTPDFLRFLSIAYGSLMEIETHIQITHRLGYVDDEAVRNLLDDTAQLGRIINGLMRSLRTKLNPSPPTAN